MNTGAMMTGSNTPLKQTAAARPLLSEAFA
jgi:hypothetical protein